MDMEQLKQRIPDFRARMSEASESLPDENTAQIGFGAFLLGVGVIVAVVNLLRGRRGVAVWVVPATLASSGLALMATGTLEIRSEKIISVEETVMSELDSLDPLARAKVLRDVAQEQVERYAPVGEE
jgi:hypothetical protein